MRKVFFYILVLTLISSTLFCLDFGGYLDNTTLFSTDEETGFYQLARLSLWLGSNLGDNWDFSIKGNYTFESDYPYLFDINQVLLKGEWPFVENHLSQPTIGSQQNVENGPSLFSVQLGRFNFSEFTGLVLDHPVDGFSFNFSYPASIVSLGFGYTGLLFKHSSSITLSKADTNDQDETEILFGTPRLIGLLQLHFPELMRGQDLYFSALFQKDLRQADQVIEEGEEEYSLKNKGGYYDSIYSGLGLYGSFSSSIFYNIFGYFQTGRTLTYLEDDDAVAGSSYQYSPVIGFLGGTKISYYSAGLSYSTFSLSFIYSTGDEDSTSLIEGNTEGPSYMFTPISDKEQRVIYNPKLCNIFYVKGSYTIKPFAVLGMDLLERILFILDGTMFFRSTTGAIPDQRGFNKDSEELYLGTEIDFIINFRPFSDLGLRLSTGYFIPNNTKGGVYFENDRDFEFLGKFELSLSF